MGLNVGKMNSQGENLAWCPHAQELILTDNVPQVARLADQTIDMAIATERSSCETRIRSLEAVLATIPRAAGCMMASCERDRLGDEHMDRYCDCNCHVSRLCARAHATSRVIEAAREAVIAKRVSAMLTLEHALRNLGAAVKP